MLKTFVLYYMRSKFFLFGTGLCLRLTLRVQQTFGVKGQALPKNWKKSLQKMKAKLSDGDLNGNGKFSNPEERIRLLYVDKP
jgi:predicted metal-dependent TIM-barrel fold hydrolase